MEFLGETRWTPLHERGRWPGGVKTRGDVAVQNRVRRSLVPILEHRLPLVEAEPSLLNSHGFPLSALPSLTALPLCLSLARSEWLGWRRDPGFGAGRFATGVLGKHEERCPAQRQWFWQELIPGSGSCARLTPLWCACFGRKDDNTWNPSPPPLLLINAPLQLPLCSPLLALRRRLTLSLPPRVRRETRQVQKRDRISSPRSWNTHKLGHAGLPLHLPFFHY